MPEDDFEHNSSGRCPHCREIVTFNRADYVRNGKHYYAIEMKTASGGDEVMSILLSVQIVDVENRLWLQESRLEKVKCFYVEKG